MEFQSHLVLEFNMKIVSYIQRHWRFYIILAPIIIAEVICIPLLQIHFPTYWWLIAIGIGVICGLLARIPVKYLYRTQDKEKSKNRDTSESKTNR